MSKKKKIEDLKHKLNMANATVAGQMEYIEMLERQLTITEKAINRKDEQFLGLRSAYQDEIINKWEKHTQVKSL